MAEPGNRASADSARAEPARAKIPEGGRVRGRSRSASSRAVRGPLETLSLAAIGALALAAGRADDVADELAERLGVDRDETRAALADALGSWRREAQRLGESTGEVASRLGFELGIASQDAVTELELRVAQLEHRLRLLER